MITSDFLLNEALKVKASLQFEVCRFINARSVLKIPFQIAKAQSFSEPRPIERRSERRSERALVLAERECERNSKAQG